MGRLFVYRGRRVLAPAGFRNHKLLAAVLTRYAAMPRFIMNLRLRLLIAGFVLGLLPGALASAAPTESSRFTDSLTAQQKTDAGLTTLSSDNVAVINALVRQDEAAVQLHNNQIRSTRFSQRRTDHERNIAGLALLSAEQLAKLDDFVGRRFAPSPAPLMESVAPIVINTSAIETNNESRRPEIHGSVSLTYGWSKGGSVMGGDLTLYHVDPERRFSVFFNYSQYHGKGYMPLYYPGDVYYPLVRPLPDASTLDR